MHDAADVQKAVNYANQSQTKNLHRIKIKDDARVLVLDSNIERLTAADIDKYSKVADILVGKNVFGKTEYVLLNKNSIQSITKSNNLKNSANVLENFKKVFTTNPSKLKNIGSPGARNKGIYEFDNYVIKLTQPGKTVPTADLERLNAVTKNMNNVHAPTYTMPINNKTTASLMTKSPGVDSNTLSTLQINKIPKQHWDKLIKDLKYLSENGVPIDLSKRSNLFYDKKSGFHFIDIDSFTGTNTGKFYKKGDKTYYVPMEKYKDLPPQFSGEKPLIDGKQLFLNIPKS